MSDKEKTRVDPESRKNRNRQLLLFSVLVAAVLFALALWLLAGGGGAPPKPVSGVRAELAGAKSAETVWIRRSESRIGQMEAQLRDLDTKNKRIDAENTRLRERITKDAADGRLVIDRQAAAIDQLRRKLEARPIAPPQAKQPSRGAGMKRPARGGKIPPARPAPMILEFEKPTSLKAGSPAAGARPLSWWLPAGAYAEAIVLAGVDASVGVSSQGDPRPVLLRLTGKARSAADDGVAMEADVTGCTLTGAAYGDLSSEKVYVRLRTMTCSGPGPGTVIETRVSGFVAGGGKAGVRGPVVSREGALVEKAFLAGLVSGAGETAAGMLRVPPSDGGAERAADLGDLGRAGLGAGAGSAGRKVADYLIRRAEQYQPVIQLQTGTRVTVVFIEGARIDGGDDARTKKRRSDK